MRFPVQLIALACLGLAPQASRADCLSNILDGTANDAPPLAYFVALGGISQAPQDCWAVVDIAVTVAMAGEGYPPDCWEGSQVWANRGASLSPQTRDLMLSQFAHCPELTATIRQASAPAPTPGRAPDLAPIQPQRTGDWFIFAGAVAAEAEAEAAQRAEGLRQAGLAAEVVSTDDFANLRDGLLAIVIRNDTKAQAEAGLAAVQRQVPDAYIKKGN